MQFDVNFRFVTAARYAPGAAIVRWSVLPHSVPGEALRFLVFRSSSPAGPWELGAEPPVGAFQYVDYDVYSPVVSRPYYYRVRALDINGNGYVDSKPVLVAPTEDHIATEMVRKKLTYMLVRTKGVLAVMIRRSWGPNCNRCYNHQRQVASDAECPDCFGTGYSGGYLNPAYTPAIVNPGKKAIISAGVEYDSAQTYVELANVPIVSPLDLLVDVRNNIRYEIKEVTPYTHAQTVVSQVCAVLRIDENDGRYTIPVEPISSEEYGAGWNLLGENHLRETLRDAR